MIYLLPHIIAESADKFPEKTAFKLGNEEISYQQLYRTSCQIANSLLSAGLKKGERVGVLLKRSLETVQAIYGIMMAGGVYVPIDPFAPLSRIKFLIDDCDIQMLISEKGQKSLIDSLIEQKVDFKLIIGFKPHQGENYLDWRDIGIVNSESPDMRILEQDLAYIIYTSGSTGTPKGIMHTHCSGLNYAQLANEHYQFHQNDIFASHAPIHFDISMLGYFVAPLVGGTTIIASEAMTKMQGSLSQLIEKERVSIWYSVPLALVQLIESGTLNDKDLSHLRWVLFAGERLDPKYLRVLMELVPNATFSNVYGPAEVNQCTYYDMKGSFDEDGQIPIGKFWGNTEGIILDQKDKELPSGKPGELAVRSGTMMSGYWNRPDLNEKAFYKIVDESEFKKVYYRTGDIVFKDELGEMHFIGRRDRQVKVRGYRVELDEVTAALYKYPAIREVAVFDQENEEGINTIVSMVSGEIQAENETELRIFLKGFLPVYAIPEQLIFVKDFPRTSTGKIDFNSLKSDC